MASQTELKPETDIETNSEYPWLADETETEPAMSDDDDFDFEEIVAEQDDEELTLESKPGIATNVPVWRLIEMSREDRFLKRELADFDDYESFADDSVGISH